MPTPEQIDPRWKKENLKLLKALEQYHEEPREILGGFKIGKQSINNEKLQELSNRVKTLENLIKSIFDDHVLINGQFVKISI